MSPPGDIGTRPAGGCRATATVRTVVCVDDDAPRPQIDPRLVDGVLAVGMALVVALVIAADLERTGRAGPTAYLFAVGFGVLVLVRRRSPRTVLVATVLGIFAYYVLDLPPIGIALPAVAALYSAAEAGRPTWAVSAGCVLVGTSGYFLLRDGRPADYLIGYEFVTNVALAAAAIALGSSERLRRETREHQRRLRRLAALEQARRAAEEAQQERLHIARDLHDAVGHALSVIAVHAGVAQDAIGRDDVAATRAVDHVRAATSETLRELRTTVRLLRTPARDATSAGTAGLARLPELAAAAEGAGLTLRTDVDVPPGRLDPAVDAGAFRILQEAVTNVLRHSRATVADVHAHVEAGRLLLTVTDEGPVATSDDVRGGVGHGLDGMRERAALLHGSLTAGTTGTGFTVRAEIPVGPA